ncbi:MAG: ATP-dependent zinc metalloprotease FtsH [Chlamydiia bacterium]|nr:ATP-dependent zinc metalloprotease FtsH [Chlamydiia bacterium]
MTHENKNPNQKKGVPGILILFIIGAFALLLMRNTSAQERANVSFSHQIEHLVNLDLLQPSFSNKVSINDNLVSFSGKFRDKKTEEAKQRFRFLTLLDENNSLKQEKNQISKGIKGATANMQESIRYFYELNGKASTFSSVVVIPSMEKDGVDLSEVSVSMKGIRRQDINLQNMITRYESLRRGSQGVEKRQYGRQLKELVASYRSSKLGIGDIKLKALLKESSALLDGSSELSAFGKVLENLTRVNNALLEKRSGVKFYGLRTVRTLLEKQEAYLVAAAAYQANALKLTKAASKVNDVVWYFNNSEMSTKGLEEVDVEEYHRWYVGSKAEWEAFPKNMNLVFTSPDQPRNLVLEKTFKSEAPPTNYFSYIFTFLPIILIGGLLYFVFSKQMKGGGSSAMNFGKSPAKQISKSQQKVTFDDVAGIDEAKEELEELVDFLKDPMRYKNLGARIPKGVLLIGAPGTGKTLTAKAVAGEAGVPFFSISGSDFVEMFVGVGASRVRDLFEQARKNSPSIIFIDEIDAVGRHRGSGLGGGHDEREQTLNQLLVEIDGMDTVSGVIIIAATNRPDVLDKALLRPGRFDRSVSVELPDYFGRLQILKVHAKKIKMSDELNLKEIARRTTGSVGADLENIINEAALHAAKKRRKLVTQEDIRYAQEKVQFGKERKSMVMNEEDVKTTAWHEAGHALVAMTLEVTDSVTMVTRVPRGQSLGATHFELKKNRVSYRKQELLDQLAVLMGGRCAEEIINKDPTSGAQMDIKQATNIARSMVCKWGMSEKVGMINYGEEGDGSLMAGFHEREFSEETARLIDSEVKRLLDEAYEQSMKLLNENYDKLQLMASMLIEFEALDKQDLDKILDGSFSIDEKKEKVEAFESSSRKSPPPVPKNLGKKSRKTPPPTKEGPAPA